MKSLIIILLLALNLTSCGDCPWFAERSYRIKVVNNSNREISVFDSFPDTAIPSQKPHYATASPQSFTQ